MYQEGTKKFDFDKYLVKVRFAGDEITPVYHYTVYKKDKRKFFRGFKITKVWKESVHREKILSSYRDAAKDVIEDYERDLEKWS